MKKTSIFLLLCGSLTSCVVTHVGTISSSSLNKPVRYEDVALGVAQVNKYLGIGGIRQDALILEAKREMVKNHPLKSNETFANYTLDFKNTYWPFYHQTKVTLTADVVSFLSDSVANPYSDNYKRKIFDVKYINDLFCVGDTIVDKKQRQYTIISLVKEGTVRAMYKTSNNKIRTRKLSVDDIYSRNKRYNGFKTGDMYGYSYTSNGTPQSTTLGVCAVGLNHILLTGSDGKTIVVDNKK